MSNAMRLINLKNSIQVLFFFCFALVFMTPEGSYCMNNVAVNYDSLIHSPLLGDRLYATQELEKGILLDSISAINELALALRAETDNPISRSIAPTTYVPETEFLKYNYCSTIIRLSNSNTDYINDLLTNASGDYKIYLIMMLGYFQDSTAHHEIGQIYKNSTDPYIRLYAIKALESYKDTLDIPIFTAALYDSLTAYDYIDESGTPINIWHPINNEAAATLKYMGYDIVKEGDSYIVSRRK